MPETWPTSLPEPNLQGFSVSPDFGVEDFQTEGGGLVQRRRYDHVPAVQSFAMVLKQEQASVFAKFRDNNATSVFLIDLINPFGLSEGKHTFRARFVGQQSPLQRHPALGYWNVQFALRLEETASAQASDEDLSFVEMFGDGYQNFVNEFAVFVNVTLAENTV